MSEKAAAIETGILDIVRNFKGSEYVEPKGSASGLNLFDDFGLDSLDLINLLFQLEEKYGAKIAAEDVKQRNLMVVGNMAEFIAEQK